MKYYVRVVTSTTHMILSKTYVFPALALDAFFVIKVYLKLYAPIAQNMMTFFVENIKKIKLKTVNCQLTIFKTIFITVRFAKRATQ